MAAFPSSLPEPRTVDSAAAPPLRWGVLGTGWIAERFTRSLQRHTAQEVVAVGSRSVESAREFAGRVGVPRAHGSYPDLVGDPGVDVVYVATPHNHHHRHALLALEAGKHVLVEKPLALDAAQAREIAEWAERTGLFCMEALWTLFLPRLDVVRRLLVDGALGDLESVIADHGEFFRADHRIQRPELAGGCLHDLAVYPLALALWAAGPVERVAAVGTDAPSGVVGQASIALRHAGGAQSCVHSTISSDTPTTAVLAGTEATVLLPGPFWGPGDVVLVEHANLAGPGGPRRLVRTEPAVRHDALHHQAAEVALRVTAGERESPLRPLADSVATLAVLDEVRSQVGARLHAG